MQRGGSLSYFVAVLWLHGTYYLSLREMRGIMAMHCARDG